MSGFFRVTNRDHNGLILMTSLAERFEAGEYLSLQDIAADMQLSQGYLEEVAASLKKAGLIQGKQGPAGGYRLAKEPGSITLEDIVTALEGPVALVDCQSSAMPCPLAGKCSSKRVWGALQDRIRGSLHEMTLASLINEEPEVIPIYLDHAATTYVDPRVMQAMLPYFSDVFANPSSFHTPGMRAKEAMIESRASISKILNARPDDIIFTSGGTESDNLALLGVIRSNSEKKHVITSAIEHPAVLEPLQYLQKKGEIELTVLPVDRSGQVSVDDVEAALRPDTVLISIMYANNEIGTIQSIADIGRALLKWRKANNTVFPYFHTDACQAAGSLDLDVERLHVDLLTLNGSKIYGPKGAGVLYVRRGTKLEPLVRGGGQERNIRSGTENVPGIVGLATALVLAQEEREVENKRLIALRDRLAEGLLAIPKSRLNGHATERLPNSVNVSFLDIEGEAAVLYLDAEGIFVSTGSACASSSLEPSHVILATGLSYEGAHGSIRFTLGKRTTAEDIERVIKVMPGIVEKLRHMSPVNLDMKYFDK